MIFAIWQRQKWLKLSSHFASLALSDQVSHAYVRSGSTHARQMHRLVRRLISLRGYTVFRSEGNIFMEQST